MRALSRSADLELLDGSDLEPDELRRNLGEMAMLNRLPGGVGASVRAVTALLHDADPGPVLDVGTGAGDFARQLRRRSSTGLVLVDRSPDVLAFARRNVAGMEGVTVLAADARSLPFADGSVAVAHASLLLHHLDPTEAVTVLRELRRVARAGIVINDLRRSHLALVMTAVPILALARAPTTRHDGILSAKRAHTLAELDAYAADAGLRPIARTVSWWPRVTTTYR
ncbi:MAG: methyltransferase domain-containing protein [Chloroflexota bacterium]|nr:methyltransferase domain-containing protein [Chloroflexota bacterium]